MNEHAGPPLEPDVDQIEIFVDAVFRHATPSSPMVPHIVSLRSFVDGSNQVFHFTPVRLGGEAFRRDLIRAAVSEARRCAQSEQATVFCPPLAAFKSQSAREDDVVEGYTLSVECDQHPGQAREQLEELLGAATCVVASGGQWVNGDGEPEDKLHLHWRLRTPARGDELAKLKRVRQLATRLVGADPASVPICHPIRWPGSWHRKDKPRLCQIVALAPDFEVELAEVLAILEVAAPVEERKKASGGAGGGADWNAPLADILAGRNLHVSINTLVAKLVATGMGEGAIVNMLRAMMENSAAPRDARWQARYDDIPRAVATAVAKFRAVAAAAEPHQLWNPWKLPFVPPFPLETLPPTVRDYVAERTETVGVDPAALAMGSLVGLSAMLDHAIVLHPKRWDAWGIHPNLWVFLSGDPADKKSPAINQIARFALAADKRDAESYMAARARAEANGEDPDKVPRPRQRIIRDITSEALCGLLAEQHCGCTLVSHELSGWIGLMDKYNSRGGASAERAMWLVAHDGGPYTQHRVRASRFVPHLCASILAAVQPDKLREMGSLDSDGLLQRFIPVMMQHARHDQDAEKNFIIQQNITALHDALGAIAPRIFALDDDARKVFQSLSHDTTDMLKANNSFGSFCGKQARTLGAIALILHACELVEGRVGATDYVSQQTIERAERMVREFIFPHARAFYGAVDSRESKDNRMIAGAILNHGGDSITLRNLHHATSAIRNTRDHGEKQQKLYPFVAGGWLTPVTPGPSNTTWAVTPGLRQRFAVEREVHNAWVAEIKGTIKRSVRVQRNQDPDADPNV